MAQNLGKVIRILRQAKDLTVSDLAKDCDISVPYLSLVEHGAREPSFVVLRTIAEKLGIPLELLLVIDTEGDKAGIKLSKKARQFSQALDDLARIENKLRNFLNDRNSSNAIK